jgi:predicted nucleotide-binding protein
MAEPAKKQAPEPAEQAKPAKRVRVSQSDVPAYSLDDALRVVYAISNEYGKQPTRPVDVATALQMMPNAGPFKMITGAAVAYGITDGGAQADMIELTDLGRRIVSPTEEGDDLTARREALLRPRVVREFLQRYDGNPLPSDHIAMNVLESLDVPRERTEKTYELIVSSAAGLGLLNDINGRKAVNLRPGGARLHVVPEQDEGTEEPEGQDTAAYQLAPVEPKGNPATPPVEPPVDKAQNRRVFISHGSNRKVVDQLRELLSFGDFEPVVSVDKETTAKPVPKKVMDDMRSCGAGIIHVGSEKTITDAEGTEHAILNENVLIEIGAAMALWGDNYILLVEEGTKLPSNLQGLYEVRYQGTALDHDATMRLLRALKEFKS